MRSGADRAPAFGASAHRLRRHCAVRGRYEPSDDRRACRRVDPDLTDHQGPTTGALPGLAHVAGLATDLETLGNLGARRGCCSGYAAAASSVRPAWLLRPRAAVTA